MFPFHRGKTNVAWLIHFHATPLFESLRPHSLLAAGECRCSRGWVLDRLAVAIP